MKNTIVVLLVVSISFIAGLEACTVMVPPCLLAMNQQNPPVWTRLCGD